MTLADKAARLVFPRLGSNLPPPVPVEADIERFQRLVEDEPFGGLVLFNGRRETTPALLERLQAGRDEPILVASDLERGAGQQIAGATLFPHARAFERLGDEAEAAVEAFAEATAVEALAAGIHIVFAPVADVNRDPRNPIIGTRAFGEDTDRTAALVRAYLRGCRRGGLLATAKHFPGHGHTRTDSHAELPVVPDDTETLERHDLTPFRAAIAEGVDLVMTAHVAYPAWDPSGAPATVSRPILHALLRGKLGFAGTTITDSLLMGAVRERYTTEAERAAALLRAGVDILLDPVDPAAAVRGIVESVERGWVEEGRVDEALGRIQALRAKAGQPRPVSPADTAAYDALADRVARGALFSRGPRDAALRRGTAGTIWVVVNPFLRDEPRPAPFLAGCLAAPDSCLELGPADDERRFEETRRACDRAGAVVVATIVRPAAWHTFGLPERLATFVRTVLASRPAVLAVLGSPQVMDAFPEAAVHICSYSDVPASQRAVVEHVRAQYLRD